MDELKQQLDKMEIPEPSPGAAQRVLSRAKAAQAEQLGFVMGFRRFRAWLFQLHIRYVVMAGVVIVFAMIGRIGSMPAPSGDAFLADLTFPAEYWAEGAFDMAREMPAPMPSPLDDLEFEFEGWAEDADWGA